MSFINCLGSDIWSEADIINRTEALIASEFPVNTVAILNRKVTASTIGAYALTDDEQADVARYDQVCTAAAIEGHAARADMTLLLEVLEIEAGKLLIDDASPPAQVLHALRNPTPVVSNETADAGRPTTTLY